MIVSILGEKVDTDAMICTRFFILDLFYTFDVLSASEDVVGLVLSFLRMKHFILIEERRMINGGERQSTDTGLNFK